MSRSDYTEGPKKQIQKWLDDKDFQDSLALVDANKMTWNELFEKFQVPNVYWVYIQFGLKYGFQDDLVFPPIVESEGIRDYVPLYFDPINHTKTDILHYLETHFDYFFPYEQKKYRQTDPMAPLKYQAFKAWDDSLISQPTLGRNARMNYVYSTLKGVELTTVQKWLSKGRPATDRKNGN